MRHYVMLIACTVLCAGHVQLSAQVEARQGVARLPWRQGAPQGDVVNIGNLWRPGYHVDNFFVGWNWHSSIRELSAPLGGDIHHIGDEHINPNNYGGYQERHTPGRVLIPLIRGLGAGQNNDRYRSPCESIALEFAPFLEWNATTKKMNLIADDETRSVFGFRNREHGQVVAQDMLDGTHRYRYELLANAVTQRTTVLSSVWPDDELRVFGETVSDNTGGVRNNHNTTEMYISVTVRRTSPIAQDETAHVNDEVLRIQIPFWMGQITDPNAPPIDHIRFRFLTNAAHNILDVNVENRLLGRKRFEPLMDADATNGTEEFIITRGMLPAGAVDQDVTIEARFTCEWPTGGAGQPPTLVQNGALIARPAGEAWRNPWFYPNGLNVHSANRPDLISRYDVVVEYAGGIDVQIKNVRLETPAARDLFWGQLDHVIVGSQDGTTRGALLEYFEDLEDRNDWLTLAPNTGNADAQGRVAGVWKFYGRDEIELMHWKSFRYLNRLLDGHLTTEVGIWWDEGMRHSLGLHELWQGATPAFHPSVASYAFEQGWRQPENAIDDPDQNVEDALKEANRRRHLGLDRGRLTFSRDPDIQLSNANGNIPIPVPPADEASISNHNGGIQAHLEYYLHDVIRPQREMLFNTNPAQHWYANIWPFSQWSLNGSTTDAANPVRFEATSNARPKSCGELRAQMWSSLVLGTHGLLFYHGADHENVRFAGNDRIYELEDPRPALGDGAVHTGLTFNDVLVNPPPTPQPPLTFANLMTSDAFGSDWVVANDRSNIDAWLFEGLQVVSDALTARPTTNPRFYIGRMAMRQVMREVLGRLDENTRETLCSLKLRGWHARGFRRYSTSKESPTEASLLAERIEIRDDGNNRLLTRPPGRVSVASPSTANPGQPMWESIDSSFVDITLLSRLDDMTMTNGFYVGVFNRRTNPMMAIPSTDTLAFHTYDELLAEWNANPDRLYAQVGAREIRLPFRVPSGTNGYRTLHVTELGAPDANAVGNRPLMRVALDTMIGQDGDLNITLLPGEGRIYRVQYVDAEQQIARGWLDHNTQRKMVVHPDVAMRQPPLPPGPIIDDSPVEMRPACINADGSGETRVIQRVRDGDQWRYHMVYHRRLTPPAGGEGADTGPLSVFYRRSAPLTNPEADGPGDELEDGTITWEPEILINDHFQPLADPPSVPSCGYPSIVVRYDPTRQQNMVYIVYACETAETLPNQNILIAEAQFPADIANQDAWYHSPFQGSYVLDLVRSSGVNNNIRLHHWGTPVINASYDGNYYAWSDNVRGIVYGFKLPQQRQFPPGGMNQVKAFAERGGIAYVSKYPSMHSYSRIRAGEVDASLVWQEGYYHDNGGGKDILYTRLRHDPVTNAVEHTLSVAPLPTGVGPNDDLEIAGSTQIGELVPGNRVLIVSQRYPAATYSVINERPTLLRLLSDFPDESMLPTSPTFTTGHLNHKPDRIVWERTVNYDLGGRFPTELSHRVVDLQDRCTTSVVSNVARTYLWTTPEGWIQSSNNEDLVLPELVHGEMKTELHVNPLTHPQFVPPSWDYDDSVMVLGFASVPMGGRHGSLYQMTYGYDLYGFGAGVMLNSPAIAQRAHVRRLREGGRSPHAAARHNVVHAQRIFKGRRIYENADPLEQPNLWARAPQMTRTNEGFFKTSDLAATGHVPTRAWQGFAGANGHATVTDLALNGKPLALTRVNDDKIMQPRKAGPQQLVSEWLSIDDVSALDMERRSSADEDRVTVYFERERDAARVPFAYFNGRQKQRWQLIPDAQERYRVVIENTGAELGFVTDLELMDGGTSLERDAADATQLVDLRRIGTALVMPGEQAIEVWPQPASDMLNVITQVGRTSQQGTLRIRDVRGTVVLQVPCKTIDLLQIPTTGMPSGTYSATLDVDGQTLGRTLVSIVR